MGISSSVRDFLFGMDEVNIECDEINKDIFQTQTHLGFIIYGVLWTSQ